MKISVLVVIALVGVVTCDQKSMFKGAVYEHVVHVPAPRDEIYSRQEAVGVIMKNLIIYNRQAMQAARESVDILVFPEYGLYGWNFDRYNITPFLEPIPDIGKDLWNPCTSPSADAKILYELSCIARNNSLYIVANMGSMKKCDDDDDDEYCPEDGHYQYNTAVVFDPNGNLIAKYDKWNLNQEPQFDYPKYSEMVTFETPFGIFGLFMCDDLRQFDPAMRMIEELAISSFVCPASWSDMRPNKIAIQDHLGFARGYGVNLLVANIHKPDENKQGSGVYTPDGKTQFYYDNRPGSKGRLVISDVNVLRRPLRRPMPTFDGSMDTSVPKSDVFNTRVDRDLYTMVALRDKQSSIVLCRREICCELEYTVSLRGHDEYVFGVYSGFHATPNNYFRYYQSCMLMRCVNATSGYCGVPTTAAKSYFTHLKINAHFSTQYVYPEFVASNRGQLDVAPLRWQYQEGVMWSRQTTHPLEYAGFFGRIYERDRVAVSGASRVLTFSVIPIVTCVFFIVFNS